MSETPIIEAPAPTPDEAAAKLVELRGNADWTSKLMAGSPPQLEEYRKLSAIALNSSDKIEKAIAGELENVTVQDSGHMQNIGAASMLREAGMEPDVIRQVLSGGTVTQQERASAEKVKARLMGDSDFTKKYMSGDAEARRQMTLLNVILTSDVKQEA